MPSHQSIEEQASLWTARLESSALTPAEREELSAWLAADPEHRYVLSRYRELCADLALQVPVLTDADEVDATVARAASSHRWARLGLRTLAAAAVLTLGLTLWWLQPQQVDTQFAERRALTLADGSRLELNANTRLEIDLGRSERRLRFTQGEAFFQIAHDSHRPLFVDTPKGAVRVTGTQFNIRQSATSAIEVTVIEGSVQATAATGLPESLTANQQATLDSSIAVRSLSPEESPNVLAWRTGQAAFQSEPLAEALQRFAPYYRGAITVDPDAVSLRVGGRYSLDDLDGFLTAIGQALPIRVLRQNDGSVRVLRTR